APPGKVPVAVDIGGIGVIIPEHRVLYPADPDVPLIGLPVLYLFRAGDHRPQRFSAAVGNPRLFRPGVSRVYIFAVYPRRNQNLVPRTGYLRGIVDMLKGHLPAAVAVPPGMGVNIDFHGHPLFMEFWEQTHTEG